jgi:hypothetical protein
MNDSVRSSKTVYLHHVQQHRTTGYWIAQVANCPIERLHVSNPTQRRSDIALETLIQGDPVHFRIYFKLQLHFHCPDASMQKLEHRAVEARLGSKLGGCWLPIYLIFLALQSICPQVFLMARRFLIRLNSRYVTLCNVPIWSLDLI